MRCHEVRVAATQHSKEVAFREGCTLLRAMKQVQAHLGGAVFRVLLVQPFSLEKALCLMKELFQRVQNRSINLHKVSFLGHKASHHALLQAILLYPIFTAPFVTAQSHT
ncbi:MAG: hypothetical protein CFK49_08360 [Armatimonadetes bacterium JP3_11]|nr:MAG: hypothetical protein CFK49_08360 [Armatimonadetes bacterium JP3_11]RMH08438.1 MAG: hypothetical protein D6697_06215 [Armatimonadota bacterium]